MHQIVIEIPRGLSGLDLAPLEEQGAAVFVRRTGTSRGVGPETAEIAVRFIDEVSSEFAALVAGWVVAELRRWWQDKRAAPSAGQTVILYGPDGRELRKVVAEAEAGSDGVSAS